jgi:hypothetical protein
MKRVLLGVVVVALAWSSYERVHDRAVSAPPPPGPAADLSLVERPADPKFVCDGRVHCSQMDSCQEARYFLRHCPGVKMDGDNDGAPCEQDCGH